MLSITKLKISGIHNVKNEIEYDFTENINHIFGENGKGKSTILQSIQYALLGYIPGTNKIKSDIFKHCNGDRMYVELTIVDSESDDRYFIHRGLFKKGKNIEDDFYYEPKYFDLLSLVDDLELPIFNYDDFYNLTSNKLKDWFMKFIPTDLEKIDWGYELTKCLSDNKIYSYNENLLIEYVGNLNDIESSDSVLDYIRSCNDYLKTSQKFKKEELGRLSSTLQSMVFYDDLDDSFDDLDDVSEELEELRKKKEIISDYLTKDELYTKLLSNQNDMMSKIKQYVDNAEDFDAYVKSEKENFEKYETEFKKENVSYERLVQDLSANRLNILDKIKRYESESDMCPVLNIKCDTLSNAKTVSENEYNELKSKYEELSDSIRNINEVKGEKYSEYTSKSTDLMVLENLLGRYKDSICQLESLKEYHNKYSIGHLDDISEQIKEKEQLLIKLSANKKYEELSETILKDKYKLEEEFELLKLWSKYTDINGMQTRYAKVKVFGKLESNMNKVISTLFSSNCTACFNITEKANDFSFGISRDGEYIPYNLLSSGEKCIFSVALFTELCKLSKSKLHVIIIDDMLDHLDKINTEKLFDFISNEDEVQYIFASVMQNYKVSNETSIELA